MTILIGPATGGVSHVTQRLAEHWPLGSVPVALLLIDDDGRVIHASCSCPASPLESRPERAGTCAWRAARAAWRHRRCLRESGTLHVELGRTAVGAFWFALAAGVLARMVPMVVTTHDIPTVVRHPAASLVPLSPGFYDRIAYRLIAPLLDRPAVALLRRRVSATVVLSDAAARSAKNHGWPEVTRVDHGAAPRTQPSVSAGKADYVLLAGFLGPGKGLDVLAAAWALVQPPLLPLIIAGGYSENHAAWVAEVRGTFDTGPNPPTWAGYVDDDTFDRLVQRSAVVVIPYEQSNPASGVLVRALVEGRAVVGTRVAAVIEEVVDGENGLLVPPGDAIALAAAISQLTASPKLRDRFGTEAAARAVLRHSWSTHAIELANLHHALQSSSLERHTSSHV